MDDSCAVCAESLEWVAYGACGHKDVCSTCVVRLRLICDDRHCCICKSESDVVFVTKAMGDYTKTINDFSILPSEKKEGRVGQYWYHEDTQAFFDDFDHYKMIKAMCRLSCSVCDMDEQPGDGYKRRARYRNVEQLKGHLFHKHRLLMCSLCLEGRKNFICEQKLYSRSQLTRHTKTGDSEVDGTESERGGFAGHPMCEFCQTPFYGDNELYTHMSTEHYTCHLCQRQNPGHHEYYKDYDNLEIHFRGNHFVCEDEGCLAKKFIVFLSEAELKRHNALEHGGRMSRAMRSAALQIPTSFRYSRSTEQDNHRGRGRTFRRDPADSELSVAIQASLDTGGASSSGSRGFTLREVTDVEPLVQPVESLSVTDSATSSRYREAISGSMGESFFPPLPVAHQQSPHPEAPPKKSMATHLHRQGEKKSNKAPSSSSRPTETPAQSLTNPDAWPSINASASTLISSARPSRTFTETGTQIRPQSVATSSFSGSLIPSRASGSTCRPSRTVTETRTQIRPQSVVTSSFAGSLIPSRASGSTGRISHSSSAPNLSERNSSSITEFPPVSAAAQTRLLPPPTADQSFNQVENVQTANKSLVEKMRAALGFDEDKFAAFKVISAEYRGGLMDGRTYLSYVEQFGLSHLVPDMARLLPNAQKQKELMDAYNENMTYNNASRGKVLSNGSKKGKGKFVESGGSSSGKNNLADNVINAVKELQLSYNGKATEEEVEVLSKDGYRGGKGKSVSGPGESNHNSSHGGGDGKSKQRKKTSKFHRVRLGDGSIEAFLDLKNSAQDPDPVPNVKDGLGESLPVRGVWKNGGGQRLLGATSKRT